MPNPKSEGFKEFLKLLIDNDVEYLVVGDTLFRFTQGRVIPMILIYGSIKHKKTFINY
jgi:hypothetical protein